MPKSAEEAFAGFSAQEVALIRWRVEWRQTAREKQLAPDIRDPIRWAQWKSWGALTGRGWGKNLTSANWIGQEAALTPKSLCAMVAPTFDDVRYTCFEGPTGLLSVIPEILIDDSGINKSLPSVRLWNGSVIRGFAADTPERLRGPQHHRVAADELGSWMYPEEAWSNLKLGLRLGPLPRLMWTTTPRPKQFIKDLMASTDVVVTGALHENAANLPDSFIKDILRYEGTSIGRQEIWGEIIDIEEMGVIKRSDWMLWPHDKKLPRFQFVLLALDTALTEKTVDSKTHDPDYTACAVWGLFEHKGERCFMLLDCWQDRLGLPALIDRVRKERRFTYGEQDAPMLPTTAFGRPVMYGNFGRPVDLICIEQQGAGRPLIQMLAKEGIFAYEYNPGKADKLQRLHVISPAFSQHRVFAVESETTPRLCKKWAEPLVGQVCSYAGKGSLPHDDLVDCCVAPDTLVVTSTGLRQIKDVKRRHKVLTHMGRWRTVKSVIRRVATDIYRMKAKALDEIYITGNHPVWASMVRYRNAAHRFSLQPTFKRADSLKVRGTYQIKRNGKGVRCAMASIHDAVFLPRPDRSAPAYRLDMAQFLRGRNDVEMSETHVRVRHNMAKPVNRYIQLDEDAGFLFGLFIAEGCVQATYRKGVGNCVQINCDKKTLVRCSNILKSHFGISRTTSAVRNAGACWVLSIPRSILAPIFLTFRRLAENKIVPTWVLGANEEFLRGFVAGYSHGDGHTDHKTGICTVTSTSLSALWGLRLVLLKLGIHSTICKTKAAGRRTVLGKTYLCLDAWGLSYKKKNIYSGVAVRREDGFGYYVEKLQRIGGEREVWNLSVSGDESYVTTGGTVHNCSMGLRYLMDNFLGPVTGPPQVRVATEVEVQRFVDNPYTQ
jgi:phage terminase large subunit-like protein